RAWTGLLGPARRQAAGVPQEHLQRAARRPRRPHARDRLPRPRAEQGVLLLDAVLTVRAGRSNSHAGEGWERISDAVIRALSAKDSKVVFVLWGAYARKKTALIDTARHAIITAPHPSPLPANRGLFGSRPFSRINAELAADGQKPIDWSLRSLSASTRKSHGARRDFSTTEDTE